MAKRGLDGEIREPKVDVTFGSRPDMQMIERTLDVAMSSGNTTFMPRMPWEASPFVMSVLEPDSMPWLKPVVVPRSLVSVPPVSVPLTDPEKVELARRRIRLFVADSVHKSADPDRAGVLQKWADLLMVQPSLTGVGQMLLDCADDSNRVLSTLQDVFCRKATSTLKTRAGSLSLLYAWLVTQNPEQPVLPLDEAQVYGFACMCRDTGKSASRVDTLVATLRFAGEYLKIPGACQAADSPRIQGVAHDMILTRRPRVRADMLTPVMVCWLEVACFALPSAYDRAIAGFCMYCIFGRLRCADANRTRHSSLLGRFVEGALSRTKTTRSKEKASSFIPLVVPSFGFLAKPWYLEFLRARQELGLAPVPPLASLAHNLEFLILPGYASLGYETAERVGSAEVSDRLRSILAKGFEADALERITSHSLKTTLLAYCNMFGVSLEQSELLGYHVNKEHQSALNYTRDSLCAPIRALIDVMRAVHVGAFVPGAPRDSMFPDATACRRVEDAFAAELGMTVLEAAESMQVGHVFQNAADEQEAARRIACLAADYDIPRVGLVQYLTEEEEFAVKFAGEASSSSSSDDSSSSSSAEEEGEAGHALIDTFHDKDRVVSPSAKSDLMRAFRHGRTKVVHCGHVEHSDRTGCGRLLSEAYYVLSADINLSFPKCKHCFGS